MTEACTFQTKAIIAFQYLHNLVDFAFVSRYSGWNFGNEHYQVDTKHSDKVTDILYERASTNVIQNIPVDKELIKNTKNGDDEITCNDKRKSFSQN